MNRLMPKGIVLVIFVILYVSITAGFSQQPAPSLLTRSWEASWISVPGSPTRAYGVYKFRKTFHLESKPANFLVHVSADNRYKLYVNGTLVSLGPARGDFFHWNFESVDISGHLRPGSNTIAALVWNEGEARPEAQITYRTAFILQGNSAAERLVNTNNTWKCSRDTSYQPLPVRVLGYYAAGAGELVDMNHHIKGWLLSNFDDGRWSSAQPFTAGNPKGIFSYTESWMLQPSLVPAMELTPQRLLQVRRSEGIQIPGGFPTVKTPVTIPARSHVSILLDQTFLTNAYPSLYFSGGKNAGISISYAEGLYTNGSDKGNRNVTDGKTFIGKKDSVISDGSRDQEFTPLWWRTYRYMQLQVDTRDEPLVLNDVYGTFTGYPFALQSSFGGGSAELQTILQTGWRTARLCAVETYMDCPYYEQLQYIGDARIQALVSLYNTGDDRLVRSALTHFDNSRMAEGITLSRFPTSTTQQIPFFSLWYIGMLHDYWMYRPDSNFIKDKLPGERQVLNFFNSYQQADGSLANVPYWTFTDWVTGYGWNDGIPPIASGQSAIFDLQLLLAYQAAAEMEGKIGMRQFRDKYNGFANQLKATVRRKYWDQHKSMFADTREKDRFSQHANALAILGGVVTGPEATALAKTMLRDTSLAPASIYFKYYLHQAAIKAGLGNDYLLWLDKWRENIRLGLTTWAEMSDVEKSRSDCHAWGASPNIEFYRTVLGIDSDAPGFARVKVEPHLGKLENASGEISHWKGRISVQYTKSQGKWNIAIQLPEGINGSLKWAGKMHPLHPGTNKLIL